MKRKVFMAMAVAVLGAGLLVGCGGEKKAETPAEKKPEPITLRVAYMPNMGSASSIVAAKESGAFEKMGLNVELSKFSGGPEEIAALNSKNIDIAQIGHGAHKLCIQGKAEVFSIDATSLADAVMGNVEKGVTDLKSLKGKTIATTAGTSADVILDLALKQAGLTRDDVELKEMDANGVVPAMVSGQIDACATWSPATVTIIEKMGDKVKVLADNAAFLKEATFPSSFIATKDYIKENRDKVVKFAAAIQLGQDYRQKEIDKVAKAVAKITETDEAKMLKSKNEGNWKTSGTEFIKNGLKDGTLEQFYKNQQKLFLDAKKIEKEVPVGNYVDFSIMQDANKLALENK